MFSTGILLLCFLSKVYACLGRNSRAWVAACQPILHANFVPRIRAERFEGIAQSRQWLCMSIFLTAG